MSTAFSPTRGRTAEVRPDIPDTPADDRWFVNESVPGKRDGTIADQAWFNSVSAVLRKAIRDAGITLDDANEAMLSQAITALATDAAGTLPFLPLAGGTLTGPLTLAGDAAAALQPVTLQQMQTLLTGLKPKGSARYATAAALPANSRAGNVLTASANGALAVDGASPAAADIVLVKNEAAPANNGLYTVTATGGASAPWQLTRASNMDAWSEVPGAFAIVEQGSANADTGWVCTSDQGGTINTTAITWTAFFGPNMFQAASTLLSAIAALGSNGLIARTGAGTAAARSVAASGTGVSVANGDGVSGNPTVSLSSILQALASASLSSGLLQWNGAAFSTVAQTGMRSPDIWVREEQVSGTNGGGFTSGADQTRVLNTTKNNTISASLGSNQITLPAGTYFLQWRAPAAAVNNHQSLLYNATDSTEVARGSSEYTSSSNGVTTSSVGQAIVTIAASKAFELRHRCNATKTTDGLGRAASFGTEVYGEVWGWKVA